jgi:CheY-like chemotaxis protein
MVHILIVEDEPTDLRIAADIAQGLGYEVDARTSSSAAKLYLEKANEGKCPVPGLILLDLDLGYESGHELLRFWHSNPKLSETRMIVWTKMAKEQQEVCRLFNVNAVVPKWEGPAALKRELALAVAKAS